MDRGNYPRFRLEDLEKLRELRRKAATVGAVRESNIWKAMDITQMESERPDPDALLAQVNRGEAEAERGRLKVFLGACAGVGKTYAMLEAVRQRRSEGVDRRRGIG